MHASGLSDQSYSVTKEKTTTGNPARENVVA